MQTEKERMTPYERERIRLAWIQIWLTVGVPFILIALNEFLKIRS